MLARLRLGRMAFIILIAGYCGWYLWDSVRLSATIDNLVIVGPAAVIVISLGIFILMQEANRARKLANAGMASGSDEPEQESVALPLKLLALLIAYGGLMPVVGFVLSTFMYVLATLILLGERRFIRAAFFSAALALSLAAFTNWVSPLPEAWLPFP